MAKAPRTEKTNVMRLLDQAGVAYSAHFYDTDDGLIDGKSVAQKTGHPCEQTFKTLLAQGPAGDLFVFVLPVDRELDLKKAAQAAAQKKHRHGPGQGFAEAHRLYPRRLLADRPEKALSHLFR